MESVILRINDSIVEFNLDFQFNEITSVLENLDFSQFIVEKPGDDETKFSSNSDDDLPF